MDYRKKLNRLLIGIIIILTSILSFYYIGWSLAPGSYARAEIYEINIPESELIKIIEDVKSEYNYLKLENYGYSDHKKGYWYSIYFYENEKNQITHTWTRAKTKNITSFAFVGYKNGKTLGNWINANEYFWWWKNSDAKKDFEISILQKIKDKIK